MNVAELEVAVVPDFSTEFADLFEARTLFFLGSWLEQFGPGEAPGLRVCSIGEPPPSVRRLGARAGAVLSVHAPVPGLWGGFANKLRGLEDAGPGRRLLVDADVLILGRLDRLHEVRADLAVAAAGKPRVPQSVWELIYAALGLPLPQERIPSLRGRLGLGLQAVTHPYEGQQAEATAMLPYYNSGVVLARCGGELRARWEDHLRRILRLAEGQAQLAESQSVVFSDQAGLATALQSLRSEGRTFELLPDAYNARLAHLRAGALQWDEIQIFHATGFLRGLRERADLPAAVEDYARRWSEAIGEGERDASTPSGEGNRPRQFLQGLWERWVRPEWERV